MKLKLSDKAMRVYCSTGMMQKTKTDQLATDAATTAMEARSDAGTFTKRLYPKHLLSPINNVFARFYASIAKLGISTGTRGQYDIPKQWIARAIEAEKAAQRELEPAKTAFIINWGQVLWAAREAQGHMFDQSTYPDVADLKDKIFLRLLIQGPSPDYEHTALLEFGETVAARAEADVTNILQDGVRAHVDELAKHLGTLADKLARRVAMGEKTDRSAPRFHDSLMENIEHIVEILPDLNFTADPRIDQIVRECRSRLRVPTEVLKNGSVQVKEQILDTANDILAQMKGIF